MIQSISFVILHLNSKAEDLQQCRQSIEVQKIPDFDVHVLSPASTQNLTSALNHKCASIKKDYIVLIDSNVILGSDWYMHLKNADFFDLIGTALRDKNGSRIVDWFRMRTFRNLLIPYPLNYQEWSPNACVSGALLTFRRTMWDKIRFTEKSDRWDWDFSILASQSGYRTGVLREAGALFNKKSSDVAELYSISRQQKRIENFDRKMSDADQAYERKKYASAIRKFNEIMKNYKSEVSLWPKMGWAYVHLKKFR